MLMKLDLMTEKIIPTVIAQKGKDVTHSKPEEKQKESIGLVP
jgi:hypothetical protein